MGRLSAGLRGGNKMCIVSMVTRGIGEQYPPLKQWPYQQVVDMSEVLKKLDVLDKKLGKKDCHEPEKDKFLKDLAERVKELERIIHNFQNEYGSQT
jgi:hypothetical protein